MRPDGIRLATAAVLTAALFGAAACRPQEPTEATRPEAEITLRCAFSESALPLTVPLANELARSHPGLQLVFLPPTHSHGAIAATYTGESDLGIVSRLPEAQEREYGLQYLHLAQDIVVFATHPGVGLEGLSSEQIRGIYTGRIRNWKQVGGPDAPITVLDRPEHTAPKKLLRDGLFGADLPITPDALVLERPGTMNTSLESVEYSIGYTTLGQISSDDLATRVLELDGARPTPAGVLAGRYGLLLSLGLVLPSQPRREAMALVDLLSRDSGQELISNAGLLPVSLNLVVATVPERDVISQEERYRPLVEHLAGRLGPRTHIGLKHLSSYENLVDEFTRGAVNTAFFGSLTYVLTRANVDIEPIARPELDGVSQYRGLILVRDDSGIESWHDLRGKSFALIRKTTAGEVFPRLFLRRNGVDDPEKFLGRIIDAGSHDASIRKVLSGEVDAGAAKDLVFQRLAKEDPRVRSQLRILASSPLVPDNALVVRKNIVFPCFSCHERLRHENSGGEGLEVDLTGRFRQALLDLETTPEGRRVLAKFGADRFVATSDSDYANLDRMLRELGLPLGE